MKPPRSLTRLFPQVKKVILAKKPVVIDVGPRDCKEGKKHQTGECALAIATKRQFHADGVAIRLNDSFVVKGTTAIRFKTPESVKREIVSFDRHHDFATGTYRLSQCPPNWSNPGKKHSHGGGGKKPHTATGIANHRTARVRTVNGEEVVEK